MCQFPKTNPTTNLQICKPQTLHRKVRSSAAARSSDELSIRVLTPTLASVGILDTTRTLSTALTISIPEESPVIIIRSHVTIGGGSASVRLASAVGGAVVVVVLVVDFEDGKSLGRRGARVVAALGGLDCGGGFCGRAGGVGGVFAFCV